MKRAKRVQARKGPEQVLAVGIPMVPVPLRCHRVSHPEGGA